MTTSTTNGTDYALVNGVLSVNNGFSGTITSTATFNNEVQTKEIDFIYDHNGMRTGKIVSENGKVEITEYTLHGKLITHLTKRTVDEKNGDEITQELHFFYDAQSKPAFVEFEGVKYRYIHNLQGDVIAIVDAAGNFVVEYKYDTWGNITSQTGSLSSTVGQINPFSYRGYIFDRDSSLYYLRTRYYECKLMRFIMPDTLVSASVRLGTHNTFSYCINNGVFFVDPDGKRHEMHAGVGGGSNTTKKYSFIVILIGDILIAIGKQIENSGYSYLKHAHYGRNDHNKKYSLKELEEMGVPKLSEAEDKFHQNHQDGTGRNSKYVVGTWGSSEVVFYNNGQLNDTPEDEGTYNVYYGDNNILNYTIHGACDVIPYLIWGNSPDDSTTVYDRVAMMFE